MGGAVPFQHGGVVNRPTVALLGEGGQTEYVLNQRQMQSMQAAMRTPSSQGTSGGANVTVINVASREEGERQAAQERALGKQVVLNYVIGDLKQGSG